MRKPLSVGILRETKAYERRAPLTPADVKWLVKKRIKVEVQSSAERIFKDSEYKKNGAVIVEKFKNATLLLGIKSPHPEELFKNKIYMIFAHVAKGQAEGMPLLKSSLKNRITLIDYEKIADTWEDRLVYFGRFAGICGMIDSLTFYGRKLEWLGLANPFSAIKPALEYQSLSDAKKDVLRAGEKIRRHGFEKKSSPFIVGITGHGNVSSGAREILDLLHPIDVHPRDILKFVKHQKKMRNRIYRIVFVREEKFRSKSGRGFYFEEYMRHPNRFESNLDSYLPYINMLIHTSYWDERFPRMVTKKMIQTLSRKKIFRLKFIGDISCDINGSIELTHRATTPEEPTFTYNPKTKKYTRDYTSKGITILAVDNLPSELPGDASIEFSGMIRDYVYQVAAHGVKDVTKHAALPLEVRGAALTQNGKLTKNYRYLSNCLKDYD
jgi:alanine dehydrogenase